MTGGSLNLASNQGSGDDILSLNPQITFFKKVYKRHTNFGLETIEITNSTNTAVDFGSSVTYKIDKTGTLINNMYIEFTLPPPINSLPDPNDTGVEQSTDTDDVVVPGIISNYKDYCCWVNGVAYAILNKVELEIDSKTIDKHNGLWYDIWNELSDPNKKEWQLVGKRDELKDPENLKQIVSKKTRYYVPLKFYFNRNYGLSLPIFLLNTDAVKVHISLNSVEKLLLFEPSVNGGNPVNTVYNNASISDFKFFTNYVFLDTAEQTRIKNNLPSEYLIETLDMKENIQENELANITLNNPVKELIWVIRNNNRLRTATAPLHPKLNELDGDDNENPNDVFNYTLSSENKNLGFGTYDTFKTLKISISNKDRIKETDATYFRTLQPYYHHSNVPGGNQNEKRKYIYSYSFAINPEEYQPSGSYNFTKSDHKLKLDFKGIGQTGTGATPDSNNFTDYRMDLFAIHYKMLKINNGSASYDDVPYNSSVVQTESIANDPGLQGVEASVKSAKVKATCRKRTEEAVVEEEKRLIAIEEEVRRRYQEKKPDVHRHVNFKKKKWGGLQQEYIENRKHWDGVKEIKKFDK